MTQLQTHDEDNDAPGYERSDANVVAVLLSGACLVALVGIAMLVAAWLIALLGRKESEESPRARRRPSAAPLREPISFEELRKRRREQEERLTRYGWVDRKHGVVHTPVQRAIDLLSERGIPGGKPTQDRKTQDAQHEESKPTNP